MPSALQALFAAPYVLGQPVVDLIVEDGGNDAVDVAFGDPPASSEHLLDPRAYFDGDEPVEVDEPEVPDGGDEMARVTVGRPTLYSCGGGIDRSSPHGCDGGARHPGRLRQYERTSAGRSLCDAGPDTDEIAPR